MIFSIGKNSIILYKTVNKSRIQQCRFFAGKFNLIYWCIWGFYDDRYDLDVIKLTICFFMKTCYSLYDLYIVCVFYTYRKYNCILLEKKSEIGKGKKVEKIYGGMVGDIKK